MKSKTIALLFAMLSLGGMVAIPGLSLAPTTAYAQIPDAGDIVGGVLDDVFGAEEEDNGDEEAAAADDTQTVEQPIDQETNQDVDQSEDNDQSNDNDQDQTGAISQDIAQGTVDGDDSAKSKSESGDAKYHSSSSSSSGDAANINDQAAANTADLTQDQDQTVDQDNTATFGDDTADLDAANVAVPIAIPINVDENQEEEQVEEPEEDTITVCVDDETEEVTLAELQDLVDSDTEFTFGECEA